MEERLIAASPPSIIGAEGTAARAVGTSTGSASDHSVRVTPTTAR